MPNEVHSPDSLAPSLAFNRHSAHALWSERGIAPVFFRRTVGLATGFLLMTCMLSQVASAQVSHPAVGAQDAGRLGEIATAAPSISSRIDLSLAFIRLNQPARAIPVLNSVIAEDARNSDAWNNLCVANTMQMAFNRAIEDCKQAVRIAPQFTLAQNNLKWAEDENRKAIAAIAAEEKIAPATRDADSYLAEGLNNLHIGAYDEAISAWKRTLDVDPKNALAANDIGTAYMFKKQTASAITWFDKAIAFDSTLQIARNNLAWAHDEQAALKK